MSEFSNERDGRGTLEWSDKSYNICLGCEHGCLYCFAKSMRCRYDAATRVPGGWDAQKLNPNRARFGAEVRPAGKDGTPGVVMFPTSHDIAPRFLPESLTTIKNLLLRNEVLIVSKPHMSVVRSLCRELKPQRDRILFRFTVGALDRALSAYWEPGAPPPSERIQCLRFAHRCGFQTSVSIEPMLGDGEETLKLVTEVEPYVTDSIWVGKMQKIPRKNNAHVAGFKEAAGLIKAQQTDEKVMHLVNTLGKHPKIRWKDSIKAVVARCTAS